MRLSGTLGTRQELAVRCDRLKGCWICRDRATGFLNPTLSFHYVNLPMQIQEIHELLQRDAAKGGAKEGSKSQDA